MKKTTMMRKKIKGEPHSPMKNDLQSEWTFLSLIIRGGEPA